MKKLSAVLRSERGDLLVSALVSLVVVGIIMGATASFLLVAAKASVAGGHNISRTILLNSTLADELPRAASYGTAPVQVPTGSDALVSLWLERDGSGAPAVLHAATAKPGIQDSSCTGPSSSARDCVLAQTPVRSPKVPPAPAYKPVDVTREDEGYSASVPAGVEVLGYVFKVEDAPGASGLTFSIGDRTTTVDIPEDGTGYYYGRLHVTPDSTVSVETSGPATLAADDAIVFYEAPDAA